MERKLTKKFNYNNNNNTNVNVNMDNDFVKIGTINNINYQNHNRQRGRYSYRGNSRYRGRSRFNRSSRRYNNTNDRSRYRRNYTQPNYIFIYRNNEKIRSHTYVNSKCQTCGLGGHKYYCNNITDNFPDLCKLFDKWYKENNRINSTSNNNDTN